VNEPTRLPDDATASRRPLAIVIDVALASMPLPALLLLVGWAALGLAYAFAPIWEPSVARGATAADLTWLALGGLALCASIATPTVPMVAWVRWILRAERGRSTLATPGMRLAAIPAAVPATALATADDPVTAPVARGRVRLARAIDGILVLASAGWPLFGLLATADSLRVAIPDPTGGAFGQIPTGWVIGGVVAAAGFAVAWIGWLRLTWLRHAGRESVPTLGCRLTGLWVDASGTTRIAYPPPGVARGLLAVPVTLVIAASVIPYLAALAFLAGPLFARVL